MAKRSCIRCKHHDENGEFNISNKNCANCLLYGNFIGFEENPEEEPSQKEFVDKKAKTLKNITIAMRILFFAVIASLILLLFVKTTYCAILTHVILIIMLITMLIRFLIDDNGYGGD